MKKVEICIGSVMTFAIGMALACPEQAYTKREISRTNDHFRLTRLFSIKPGCAMYRFMDFGVYHYFTSCGVVDDTDESIPELHTLSNVYMHDDGGDILPVEDTDIDEVAPVITLPNDEGGRHGGTP